MAKKSKAIAHLRTVIFSPKLAECVHFQGLLVLPGLAALGFREKQQITPGLLPILRGSNQTAPSVYSGPRPRPLDTSTNPRFEANLQILSVKANT